jgi:hypothetical protein
MSRSGQGNFFFINSRRLAHFETAEAYRYCSVNDQSAGPIANSAYAVFPVVKGTLQEKQAQLRQIKDQKLAADLFLQAHPTLRVPWAAMHELVIDTVASYKAKKWHT